MKIEVTYTGKINKILDQDIKKALESIGCKWYAQGYTLKTKERDMAFDYDRR